ncbi:MAG: thioredoxin domain-containing protein [Halobacteriota archaeon]
MTDPTERNRLDDEESPYLQAHADNPVNWQPWDDAALEAARERDVPIFLSVGYSSCHWCHVMAEESFEDPAVAERLNREFVPIKVDREERPDIDSIYMTVCRLVSQGGCGWPLSVWLTPDGRPFFVGTYFPNEAKHGRPAFGDLLDDISESWETDRDDLEARAEQWLAAAKGELEDVPIPSEKTPGSDLLEGATAEFVQQADRTEGGFGRGQKFPQVGRLLALARVADRTGDEEARAVLTESLDAMAEGGLRDQLGGGFHRYCVDRTWTVPHFEKMLYDNAEIPRAFLAGYQLTGEQRYAAVVEETIDFVERELRHPDGGFYSTLDARSQPPGDTETEGRGEEGVFYTWTPESVTVAMDENAGVDESDAPVGLLADLFSARFGVTEAGNFEGQSVLTQSKTVAELADDFDRDEDTVASLLAVAMDRARAGRAARPRPPRDEKVLAGWNGLLIATLAEAALALDDERYARMGTQALEFVREHLWDGETLAHRYKDGDVTGEGYLEDYAFLARGALALHGATGDLDPLAFALELGRTIQDRFWDAERGTLFFTAVQEDGLPVRPQEVSDQSTPSSTGVAVAVLSALDAVDPDAGFASLADRVLRTHAESMQGRPGQYATLALAADDQSLGHLEVTVAAETIPSSWRRLLGEQYVPARLLTRRPPDDETLEEWLEALSLDEAPPIWAGRAARDGPTAFVCRNACSPPLDEAAQIQEWIDEFRATT